MFRPTIHRCLPRRFPPPARPSASSPPPPPSPSSFSSRSPPISSRYTTGGSDPISFRLTPHLTFVAGTLALSLGGAAWYTNQDTLERSAGTGWWSRALSGGSTAGLQPSLARQRWEETYASAAAAVRRVGEDNRLAIILAENWVEMTEAKRTCAGLIAGFVGVWIAWRIPGRRVGEWLAHQPLSGRAVTLLTSTFSHRVSPLPRLLAKLNALVLIPHAIVDPASPRLQLDRPLLLLRRHLCRPLPL